MSLASLRMNMVITMVLLFGMPVVLALVAMYYFNVSTDTAVPAALTLVMMEWGMSPSFVTSSARLHYLKKGENPFLETTVRNLAKKAEIHVPRIAVVRDETPNAFVFGRTTSTATLVVHQGLLTFRPEEVEAVIAHEIGHLKHKDVIIMTLAIAVPTIAEILVL